MLAAALLPDLKDSSAQRQTMVDCQVRTFDVTDQRLIARFRAVPRERFLPDDIRDLAYSDIGFVLKPASASGDERYLLPPLILAKLIQGGRVRGSDRILDVAGGTGYSAAILAGLGREVVVLESDADRVRELQAHLASLDLASLQALDGNLADGAAPYAPYDVILVNGATEANLDTLFSQLSDGGRLVTIRRAPDDPTGRAAKAVCFEKRGTDVGTRVLFDASAPVLPAFRKVSQFVF